MEGREIQFIKIDLVPNDVERFKLFQLHYKDFCILLESGLFELEEGNYTIHKSNGTIMKVVRSGITYKI